MQLFKSSHGLTEKLDALNKSQAVIEFNLDGTIVTANPNFLNAMGYRLDEIQGKHHSMFVDPELRDRPEYREFWTRCAEESTSRASFSASPRAGARSGSRRRTIRCWAAAASRTRW